MFEPNINVGDTISNKELVSIFKVNPQQDMRRSLENNCLVLVSDHTKGLYEDKWKDNTIHYTGMGNGNQHFSYKQNKTVYESRDNGITLFLFEVLKPTQYIYQGEVELAQEPYMSTQVQKDFGMREVCIFPLKVKNKISSVAIEMNILQDREKKLERKMKRENLHDLKQKASMAKGQPSKRKVYTNAFERNPYVKEYTLRKSNGICQLCKLQAPFQDKSGHPYLEVHHIEWLSKGGDDTIENAIALCPNCHRKMHILNDHNDVRCLKKLASVSQGTDY